LDPCRFPKCLLYATLLGVSLSEAIDLLADLGVRSPMEYDDYLKGYAAARDFLGG
jgi:hypothetical protein